MKPSDLTFGNAFDRFEVADPKFVQERSLRAREDVLRAQRRERAAQSRILGMDLRDEVSLVECLASHEGRKTHRGIARGRRSRLGLDREQELAHVSQHLWCGVFCREVRPASPRALRHEAAGAADHLAEGMATAHGPSIARAPAGCWQVP